MWKDDLIEGLKEGGQKILLQVLVFGFCIAFLALGSKVIDKPVPSAMSLMAFLGVLVGYGVFIAIDRAAGIHSPFADFSERAGKMVLGGFALALAFVIVLFAFESKDASQAAKGQREREALQREISAANRQVAENPALQKMISRGPAANPSGKPTSRLAARAQ